MTTFKHHEVKKDNSGQNYVILYLDPRQGLEEFSAELGEPSNGDPKSSIDNRAIRYVKEKLPDLRVKGIKVMVGTLLVSSIVATPLVVGAEEPTNDTETTAEVQGGEYELGDLIVGDFTTVVLEGKQQMTHADLESFPVVDPTGTGNGWTVNMKATPFTLVGDGGENETLPQGSLRVVEPTVNYDDPHSSELDTISRNSGAIDTDTGLNIVSAERGGGMGSYVVSFGDDPLELTLNPADVRSGTYTSTISVTLGIGPS
ncbi:WxL domain-containing protein [Texcoconibacillus texcoconensis]|uniref:WxL domain-containing protein n=1 Tax=Texcoconibacillus texcoconensis TaxID=1095777 RepID=A0A840QTK9_9BACI|nr:WxL domain-containing protein [Texcoconibacillus texcoconensis]MBB5174607.1 hypothetical protein [Texcoconibacillus texcoconensis]